MLRDLDEKSDIIRLNGNEIVELRKEIRILKNENSILKDKIGLENKIQMDSTITQEIESMNPNDLKNKILKMAHV